MLQKKLFLKTNSLDNLELLFDNSNLKNCKINQTSLSEYLCLNCPYLNYIKHSLGSEKFSHIIEIINYEVFEKNQIIIKYGEEVNKFYILFQGLIEIYKTKPKIVDLTLREYIDYLSKVKNLEKNNIKLERIMNQNPEFDNYEIKKKNFDYRYFQEKKKVKIYLEEEVKIAEFENNFTFGDISIIKKEPIEQTILSVKKSIFLTIDKIDYNRFLRIIEENKINEKVNKFKKKYPFFSLWPSFKCYKLFNSFQKLILYKGDFLFKQNSKPDGIYVIKKGKFELINYITFSWLETFIDYIHDSSLSILNDIVKVKIIPNNILRKYIYDNIVKNENLYFSFKDMKNKDLEFENYEIYDNSNLEKYSFKSIIKNISSPEILGYEECFEFKQRYYSVKCISERAEIYKISIEDFFLLLPYDKKCEIFMKKNLLEKKMYLISQLKNNALKRVNFIDEDIREKILRLTKEDEIISNKKIKLNNKNYKNTKILYKSESTKNFKNKVHNFKNTIKQSSQILHLKSNLSFNENKNFFILIKNNNLLNKENLLSKDNLNLKGKLLRNNSQTIKLIYKSSNILHKSSSLPKLVTLDDKNRMIKIPYLRYQIPTHYLSLNSQSHLMRNHYIEVNNNKRDFKSTFN